MSLAILEQCDQVLQSLKQSSSGSITESEDEGWWGKKSGEAESGEGGFGVSVFLFSCLMPLVRRRQ